MFFFKTKSWLFFFAVEIVGCCFFFPKNCVFFSFLVCFFFFSCLFFFRGVVFSLVRCVLRVFFSFSGACLD